MITQQLLRSSQVAYTVTSLGVGLTTAAHAVTIDFKSHTDGPMANGFMSAGSLLVQFRDSLGEELFVDSFPGGGKSLAVSAVDPSALGMDYLASIDSLRLDSGNDDPAGSASAGDLAVLGLGAQPLLRALRRRRL